MPNITWASQLHPEYSCDASNRTDSMSDDGLTFNDNDHLGMRHKTFFFFFSFCQQTWHNNDFYLSSICNFLQVLCLSSPTRDNNCCFLHRDTLNGLSEQGHPGILSVHCFLSIHVALTSPFWTTNSFIYSPIGVPIIVPWNVLCLLRDTLCAFKHIPHV